MLKNTVFVFRRSASRSGRRSSRWRLTARTSPWTTRTTPSSRPTTIDNFCSGFTGGRKTGRFRGVEPEPSTDGGTTTGARWGLSVVKFPEVDSQHSFAKHAIRLKNECGSISCRCRYWSRLIACSVFHYLRIVFFLPKWDIFHLG